MGMLSGKDDGATGGADGVRDKALFESDALLANAINVGCRRHACQPAPVGTDGVAGVIVGHDEEDIGAADLLPPEDIEVY